MNHEEYKNKQRIARSLFTRHDHTDMSQDVRQSCAACMLNGYHPKGERRDFINYAGWARVYIEAGRFIPSNLQMAFLAELASENRAYANALIQDIRDFGINCKKPSAFHNAIREVLGIWD